MREAIGILGAAYYLPPTTKTVQDVFRDEDVAGGPVGAGTEFRRDIGIERVHVATTNSATSLGLEAARRAVDQAGVDPGEIDLIVDFTSIPEDYIAPTWSAAGLVQDALGAERALATAVNTGGCASYHVALQAACALMRANDEIGTALLFAGDKVPPLNHTYYPITVICDGGSAVLLRKGHPRRVILAVETATVGKLHDVWYVPGLAHRDPLDSTDRWLHMVSDLDRFRSEVVPVNLFMFRKVIRSAMKSAGVAPEDVSYFIYPTFSSWDQRSFCEGLGIAPDRIYTAGLARHGHLQESDMVLNYVDAEEEGRIRQGDIVMLTTNGAGFTWGAALVRQ